MRLLYEQAEKLRRKSPQTYYGDVIAHAYSEKNHIAKELLRQATPEQIGGASPRLLHNVALRDDYISATELVQKGIHADDVADKVIEAFRQSPWAVKHLLEQGMEIAPNNYKALHACINTGNTEAAQMLLDRGMDFGNYVDWTKVNTQYYPIKNNDTFDQMYEHWKQDIGQCDSGQQSGFQQPGSPQMGGMSI